MGLSAGTRLGPYEINAPLGTGGMGEVYRARDTRLDRMVAVKVLPHHLSSNPDLKQRLEREARAISSLNHARICVLYDVGHQDGIDFLVMEYLEGESLADRLKRGPLPLKECLKVGAEICHGLEVAHRAGITHRDLKPGNIMLTKTGAKLMDFGLAKATVAGVAAAAANAPLLSGAKTMSEASPISPLTVAGSVIGTVEYMSPEQLEGKEANARSDLFAVGTVLYEMVTGQRPFEGKSQISVASAILEKDPEPISAVQPLVPPLLERTVRKCLAKQPEQRWQNASDLAAQLEWMADADVSPAASQGAVAGEKAHRTAWIVGAVVLVLAVAALAWIMARRTVPIEQVMRFSMNLPPGEALGGSWWWYPSIAIAPDGSQIAFVAHHAGLAQIYLRQVGEFNSLPVPGSEGGEAPFFSPDGDWLGFTAGGKLQKVPVAGGPAVTIANIGASSPYWAADGNIYFSSGESGGLFKVPASGGEPQHLTTLDSKHNETDHRFPEMLPGGKALLFALRNASQPSFDEADIAALSLATGERKILIHSGTNPHYLPSGHLVFIRAGVLLAVPFDPERLEVKGAVVPVAENVLENPRIGSGQYAVSRDGSLVYIPGGVTYGEHELVFVDKTGNARLLTATRRPYEDFTISPDGHSIAATVEGPVTNTWIHDIDRDTDTRFNFGVENRDPAWTPNGKHISYSAYKDGKYRVLWKPLDGGPEETLLASDDPVFAWFWMPDGRALLYAQISNIGENVGIIPMDDRQHARLLFPPQYGAAWAIVSPDGKWIAFDAGESGRSEVYVAPFPALAPRQRISTDGGMHPLWSPDGRELYYRTAANVEDLRQRSLAQRNRVTAVPIETKPTFKAGKPHTLFEGPYFSSGHDIAITPDGRGFILIRESEAQHGPSEVEVVLHWFKELKQRVPVQK